MSSRKVKSFTRNLLIKTATYTDSTKLTLIETELTHYLVTGDLVTLRFPNFPQILLNVEINRTSATAFTIVTPQDYQLNSGTNLEVGYYSHDMTGGQEALTLSSSTALVAVIQSHVSGTGGAVYVVEGSLDNIHWSGDAVVITHLGVDQNTQAITIAPSWAYVRINITSIGASTKLYLNLGA